MELAEMKYLELLVAQQKIQPDNYELQARIDRVNEEIESRLGMGRKQVNPHLQDAVKYAMASALFEQKESPLRYGIMYQESSHASDIKWYQSEEGRDKALKKLAETGSLAIENETRTTGRIINPHSFAAVNMPETYFSRKTESADWCGGEDLENSGSCMPATALNE